mgnify:CR=1 FL=1
MTVSVPQAGPFIVDQGFGFAAIHPGPGYHDPLIEGALWFYLIQKHAFVAWKHILG